MSHEPYIRTNQKIYFAGISLAHWHEIERNPSLESTGKIQAARESSLFHLHGALLGLCHEILSFYHISSEADTVYSVASLLQACSLDTNQSPELIELLELSKQPHSWLANLLKHYALLHQPLRSGEAYYMPLPYSEVEHWRMQLKAIILRFREAMTEW